MAVMGLQFLPSGLGLDKHNQYFSRCCNYLLLPFHFMLLCRVQLRITCGERYVNCVLLSVCFPTKTLYTPLHFLIRATCPAHLILLDMVTRTTLGLQYRPLSSSLCSFLHSQPLLGPNILLNTLFSKTLAYVPLSM